MSVTAKQLGKVLLICGASGTGKTSLAKALVIKRGITWVQVDDLRLALQQSNVRMPSDEATEALYFFVRTPDLCRLPAERLRDSLIAVAEVMAEAIAIVAANHIAQNDPAVVEGDGIHPALIEHPDLREYVATGHLTAVLVTPSSEEELLGTMISRGRGVPDKQAPGLSRIAEMNWLYSQWLEDEARQRTIHILPTNPWDTLIERAGALWDHQT